LEAIGYTVESFVAGAWSVSAPHKRERVFILGFLSKSRVRKMATKQGCENTDIDWASVAARLGQLILGYSHTQNGGTGSLERGASILATEPSSAESKFEHSDILSISESERLEEGRRQSQITGSAYRDPKRTFPNSNSNTLRIKPGRSPRPTRQYPSFAFPAGRGRGQCWWEPPRAVEVESRFRRGADGFSRGLDSKRLKALGNAVLPQIVYLFGLAILEMEAFIKCK
jgi:DNA (cytosine-5)-methyltransferase 1